MLDFDDKAFLEIIQHENAIIDHYCDIPLMLALPPL